MQIRGAGKYFDPVDERIRPLSVTQGKNKHEVWSNAEKEPGLVYLFNGPFVLSA